MPHSYGYRGRTRQMFARGFRKSGYTPLSTYMTNYKLGDYVDIKVNPSIHKGMPFKHYHGRTGVIYNVTKRAVGVRVNKQVNGRILKKAITVRVEHIRPSKCRDELKRRVKENEAIKAAARAGGERQNLKRQPKQPKGAYTLVTNGAKPETIQALPFVDLV
eukprot:TRINITY_DN1632_c0_g2_i1.p2 TRINITY_DN1632_c0_g2~~TRINITY_DN1632_c0_g2_i1.p2  ORF type:complete len:161 (+),score=61.54 TRINITY_DN1632_c0_g2_i1:67-549(+)